MELTKEYFDEQLDNLVTKEYFEEKLTPIREDLRFLKNDVAEIKETVTRIDKRDLEDSNALAKSFVGHDIRLKAIESDVKEIKEKTT